MTAWISAMRAFMAPPLSWSAALARAIDSPLKSATFPTVGMIDLP
jgi:hypothetical protein